MDENKKIVILLGAGAAVPWGGKNTNELTDELIKYCTIRTNNNENYLAFIQRYLAAFYNCCTSQINFEDILNFIEWLHDYHSGKINKIIEVTPDYLALFTLMDELVKLITGGFKDFLDKKYEWNNYLFE